MAAKKQKKKKDRETEPEAPKEDLEELRTRAAERDEYYDLFLRSRADLDNFSKRVGKEKLGWSKGVLRDFILDLLPALDALRAAVCHPEDVEAASLLDGIRLMEKQLAEAFEKNGIEIIQPESGDVFDPALHEAMMVEPSEDIEPGRITEVMRCGFKASDMLIRAAQVKVVAERSEVRAEDEANGH